MWFLKQRKKEIEKDIAKLEQKLEKINAKIAKKEEKRLGKKADALIEQNKEYIDNEKIEQQEIPSSHVSVEEIEDKESVVKEVPKAKRGRPKKQVAEVSSEPEKKVVKRGRPKKKVEQAENKEPEKKTAQRGRPKKVVSETNAEQKPTAKKATEKKAEPKSAAKPAPKKAAKEQTAATVRYHVGFDEQNNKWIIKKSGAKRVIASFKTKEEALERAKDLAKTSDAKLSVQRKNGQFGKIY